MLQLHLSDQQFNCLFGVAYIRDLMVILCYLVFVADISFL